MICHKDVQERVSGIVQDNKRLRRSDQIFLGILLQDCIVGMYLYLKCSVGMILACIVNTVGLS